jgi:hypothetical protein
MASQHADLSRETQSTKLGVLELGASTASEASGSDSQKRACLDHLHTNLLADLENAKAEACEQFHRLGNDPAAKAQPATIHAYAHLSGRGGAPSNGREGIGSRVVPCQLRQHADDGDDVQCPRERARRDERPCFGECRPDIAMQEFNPIPDDRTALSNDGKDLAAHKLSRAAKPTPRPRFYTREEFVDLLPDVVCVFVYGTSKNPIILPHFRLPLHPHPLAKTVKCGRIRST